MASLFLKAARRIRRQVSNYDPRRKVPRRIIKINGIALDLSDHPTSLVRDEVKWCLEEDLYGIESIAFHKNDIIIDVGANIGMVSLYIAKRFPSVKLLSYEPIPTNYFYLMENIRNNGVENIQAFSLAITKDRRDLDMIIHSETNTGGGTACLRNMKLEGHEYHRVKSITLDDIFISNNIERCRLLKIDCEGSEHEILRHAGVLNKIDYLSAEFHINNTLESQGYNIEELVSHCRKYFSAEKMRIHSIRMAE
jgi:FkbM family methyltransferase